MKSPLDLAHGLLGKARSDGVAANAIIDTGLAFDAVRYDQDFDPSGKQAWLALQTAESVFGIAAEFVERR